MSDDRRTLAVGYDVWRTADVFSHLEQIVPAEDISLVIVGYPLTLRGEVGPKARQVDLFIQQLVLRGYAVRRWDERYTTQDASRSLSERGITQRKQRGRIDMSAAVLMLQSFLDASRHGQGDCCGG